MSNAVEKLKPAEVAPMTDVIERIASDPNIPMERLEKMLEMKERMEDRALEAEKRAAKQAYLASMAECQAEIPVIKKNQTNTHTRSMYADLAAILEVAGPIISKHGFSTSFQPKGYNDKGELKLQWKIGHKDGHEESDVAEIPLDGAGAQGKVNKTGVQAFGSTTQYGRRYLTCMLFNISTGDDNDGNAPAQPITADQVKEIQQNLDRVGSNAAELCKYLQIESLPDMPASRFKEAMAAVNQYQRNPS